ANQPISASLLEDPSRTFDVAAGERGLSIRLSGEAPDPIDSVVVLKISGKPEALPFYLEQGPSGDLSFGPDDAELLGERIRVESVGKELNLAWRSGTDEKAEWLFSIDKPRSFEAKAKVAAPADT